MIRNIINLGQADDGDDESISFLWDLWENDYYAKNKSSRGDSKDKFSYIEYSSRN